MKMPRTPVGERGGRWFASAMNYNDNIRPGRLLPVLKSSLVLVLAPILLGGCMTSATLLQPGDRTIVDRKDVEYPAGTTLETFINGLTAANGIAWDDDGTVIIAESGGDGREPRILAWHPGASSPDLVYPYGGRIPLNPVPTGFKIYGPVGGIAVDHHKIYVSHRDSHDRGVITCFDYEGKHTTIIADLPAEGDYAVTDLKFNQDLRLYFGVGAATNSGVVGLDNTWLKNHQDFCDRSYVDLELQGYRFDTINPFASIFQGRDIAVTVPFLPFGARNMAHIPKAANGKPTACVCSVNANGGDFRVEAHGIRCARGLAVNEFNRVYFTNQGMQLRGTRPILNDADVVCRLVPGGTWYGWPDYAANGMSIGDKKFQPPPEMCLKYGYSKVSELINHVGSGLRPPDPSTLVAGEFQWLSGAAKLDFGPAAGPFSRWHGDLIVALDGDRAPYATNGLKLENADGYKVVRMNADTGKVEDFVYNTRHLPISQLGQAIGLERPVDVKFGPDGALYIVDYGQIEVRTNGLERVISGTSKVYRLAPTAESGTH